MDGSIPSFPSSGGMSLGSAAPPNAPPPFPDAPAATGPAPPAFPSSGGMPVAAPAPDTDAPNAPPPSSLGRDLAGGALSNIQGAADAGKTLFERITNPNYALTPSPNQPKRVGRFSGIPVMTGKDVPQAQIPGVTNFVNNTNPQGMLGNVAFNVGAAAPTALIPGGEAGILMRSGKAIAQGVGAGVGQTVGQNVGGNTGAIIGGIAGALAPDAVGAAIRTAGRAVSNGMAEALPITQTQMAKNISGRLANAGVDMQKTASTIDPAATTGVGGILKNTAQASNDPAMARFSFVARNNPQFNAPLLQSDAAQAAARGDVVQGLQKNEIDPQTIKDAVSAKFADIRNQSDAATATAQKTAEDAASGVGHEVEPELVGQALRENVVQPAFDAQKAAISKIYDAVDPDGRAAIDTTSGRQAIEDAINADRVPGEPITGPQAKVQNLLDQWQDVIPYNQAKVFRTKLSEAISDSSDRNVARQLKGGLAAFDNMIAGNVADSVTKPPIAADMSPEVGAPVIAPAEAFTPAGRSVGVRYTVKDANDLIASHNDVGEVNPAYPPDIQPRDRSRAASVMQINKTAADLKPQMLGYSHSTTDGAPIVGPDGVVESGNGRVLAIKKAYDLNQDGAGRYRDWLSGQGYNTNGIDRPVLVRERTTPMSPEDRVAFARESNMSSMAPMSRSEQAQSDAKQIDDGMLQNLQHEHAPTATENRPFVRNFISKVASPHEAGSFLTRDGDLSMDGANRIKYALLAKAYKEDPSLIEGLTETDDPNVRALGNGLLEGAPAMAKLQSAVETGRVPADKALSDAVTEALGTVAKARKSGVKLPDMVAQADAFNRPSDLSEAFLKTIYGDDFTNRVSRNRVGGILSKYAQSAIEKGQQSDIFGASEKPIDLLKEASAGYDRTAATRGIPPQETRGVSSAGPGGGEAGDVGDATRSGIPADGPGGKSVDPVENRSAGNDEVSSSGKPIENVAPKLQANWTRDHVDRYKAASARFSDFASKFYDKSSPLSSVLKKDFGRYGMSDERVASRILNVGPNGARDYQKFRDAVGGDGEANALLEQHLVNKLLQSNVVSDGVVDAKKYAGFAKTWGPRLNSFPVLKSKFENAASAQATVTRTAREGAEKLDQFQKSALGPFLGDKDVSTVAQNILSKDPGTAAAQMRAVSDSLRQFPAANDAWREGVAQHLVQRFVREDAGGQAVGISRPDALIKFVNSQQRALTEALGGEAVKNLREVAGELRQDQLLFDAGKAKGISDTARINAAMKPQTPRTVVGKMISGLNSKMGFGAVAGAALATHGVSAMATGIAGRFMEKTAAQNGIHKADELMGRALADPVLFKTLAEKVPTTDGALNAWLRRFSRSLAVSTATQISRASTQKATP